MKVCAFTVIAATSGLASATLVSHTGRTHTEILDPNGDWSWQLDLDVSGMQFNDIQGSALNQVFTFDVGDSNVFITGIGWDVRLSTIGESWASEAIMNFQGQLELAVGFGDGFPVSNIRYTSGGVIDLTDRGFDNIAFGNDGLLNIEFYEGFVDNQGTGDAFFEEGSIITLRGYPLPIPASGTSMAIGLGSLFITRRKR